MKYWRLVCETEGVYKYVESNEEPYECPDNANHVIRDVVLIGFKDSEGNLYTEIPKSTTVLVSPSGKVFKVSVDDNGVLETEEL